jgi:hypothetical protein
LSLRPQRVGGCCDGKAGHQEDQKGKTSHLWFVCVLAYPYEGDGS